MTITQTVEIPANLAQREAAADPYREQRRKDHEPEDRLDALHEEERRLDRARRQSGA